MIRKIITIDQSRCNGCGLCATACHEGAIGILDGKATLLREDYCDGLGDCLPACPTGAISFEERDAAPYNESAVLAAKASAAPTVPVPGMLENFPVQLKLVPPNAPWLQNADLLIAADCCAYAYGNFHAEFIRGKSTLIGCPKLDSVDYSQKLLQIIQQNSLRSITVVRMQVPCCGGLPFALMRALEECGSNIPVQVVTISSDGRILSCQ